MFQLVYIMKSALNTLLLLFVMVVFWSSCQTLTSDSEKLKTVAPISKDLKELSGLIMRRNHLWTLEDSGNESCIYEIGLDGTIKATICFESLPNKDWEAITSDAQHNWYIGDFGNNANDRKDLVIYKVSTTTSKITDSIFFSYPEQDAYPPEKTARYYDCEAFFYFEGYLYLFTKNRSKLFDGTTFLYKVPATSGKHEAVKLGAIQTCSSYRSCVITDAAISLDGKKVALLGHDRIWLFENYEGDQFLSGTFSTFSLGHYSQKEGICFATNDLLYIVDERDKKSGGNLYEVSIEELKNAH